MARFLTLAAVVAVVWYGSPALAQDSVALTFANGHVTLVAQNASLGRILSEWQRLGGTRFVNSERLPGSPVTLELTDVPERQALAVLLRAFSGYMASPRSAGAPDTSALAVVVVMPTLARATPAPSPGNASSNFGPPAQQRPTNRGFGVRPGIQVGGDPNAEPGDPDMGGDPQDDPDAFPPGMPGGAAFPGMPTAPPDAGDPSAAVPQPGAAPGFPGMPGTATTPGMIVPSMPAPGAPPKPPKPPGSPEARAPLT